MAEPAQKPRYHHGDLRAALIAAAQDILAQSGVAALSLRGVAARAGVSHAAPYRHFADKEDLLAAVAAAAFERLTASLDAAAPQIAAKDPDESLVALACAYFRFAAENPDAYRLIFATETTFTRKTPELEAAGAAAFARLADGVRRCLPANAAEAAALGAAALAWAELHGLAMLLLEGRIPSAMRGGLPDEALIDALATGLAQSQRIHAGALNEKWAASNQRA